jgi:CRISPR-associated endonuclease/helicase Cas3
MSLRFERSFEALTGKTPFPWQRALFDRFIANRPPESCDIPTGLGKTSVIAIWLLARAEGAKVPRRLVYVVNRRTVVDQTTDEVQRIRDHLEEAGIREDLAISTLRGQMADNREWSRDPSRPAVICGTVDMIGSRLLFSGYRSSFRLRPLHAGFLGQDSLLVHDEAHLEPAFQKLLEQIVEEQRKRNDLAPLQIMALTATPHGNSDLSLSAEDEANPEVAKRIGATKMLSLHPHGAKDLLEKVTGKVLELASSGRAILVFLRSVEDVTSAVSRLRKAGLKVQQLTGTMRGLERDELAESDPIFRRFVARPDQATASQDEGTGTVVLVCTSAGEVGVNLSADHMVCDLSTFDSMAQRFGRVNRLGRREDTEVHVFHPEPTSLEEDKAPDAPKRLATLRLLADLHGSACPAAIGKLDPKLRREAFAPQPETLSATEVLFDAWAMTTIRDWLPGRPPVSAYLHGVSSWEPPTTQVAWREEVDRIQGDLLSRYSPRDLIDDFPLKPHELLQDRTSRILETLRALADKHQEEAPKIPIWVIDENGEIDAEQTLARLAAVDRKDADEQYANCTLLLSPRWLRPVEGILSEESWNGGGTSGADVAEEWFEKTKDLDGKRKLRCRVIDQGPPPPEMRLIRTIVLDDGERSELGDSDRTEKNESRWRWYELPLRADDENSRAARARVALDVHRGDVEGWARRIVGGLSLDPATEQAIVVAAKLHDLGKSRKVWQRSIGNWNQDRLLAKSGSQDRVAGQGTSYRHELGSIVDCERKGLLSELTLDQKDLVLHLIAAHHGRARPHFPAEELFDPEGSGVDFGALGGEIMTRFARLQRRYGRWGLAYLESLLRAADYAASAEPSTTLEDGQ